MPWPNNDLNTNDFDSGTDNPSLARTMFVRAINAITAIITMRGVAGGICDLDANGEVPGARIRRGLSDGTASLTSEGTVNRSELPDASADDKGAVELADTAERKAGTAGKVIDAAQHKAALDAFVPQLPYAIVNAVLPSGSKDYEAADLATNSQQHFDISNGYLRIKLTGVYWVGVRMTQATQRWFQLESSDDDIDDVYLFRYMYGYGSNQRNTGGTLFQVSTANTTLRGNVNNSDHVLSVFKIA